MASNSGPPPSLVSSLFGPTSVPQTESAHTKTFQSKQYFGSPGSPSENPFAFIDTSLQPTASMESHPPQGNQGNQPPPPMSQGIGQPPMLVPHTYQPQPSFNSELTVFHLSFPETFPSSSETDQLLVAQDPSFDDTSHLLDSSPYHPSPTSDPSPPLLSSEPHPLSPAPYHSEPHPLNPTPYHSVSQASDPSPFIPMSIPHPPMRSLNLESLHLEEPVSVADTNVQITTNDLNSEATSNQVSEKLDVSQMPETTPTVSLVSTSSNNSIHYPLLPATFGNEGPIVPSRYSPVTDDTNLDRPVLETGLNDITDEGNQTAETDSHIYHHPPSSLPMTGIHPPLVLDPNPTASCPPMLDSFPPLPPSTVLEQSPVYEYSGYHGSNVTPPLPLGGPTMHSQSMPSDLNAMTERMTNAHTDSSHGRLTNANIPSDVLEVKEDVFAPTNYPNNQLGSSSIMTSPHNSRRSSNVVHLSDVTADIDNTESLVEYPNQFPLSSEREEERAITEGDSNPPSASQSVSSLLEGDNNLTLESPFRIVPPASDLSNGSYSLSAPSEEQSALVHDSSSIESNEGQPLLPQNQPVQLEKPVEQPLQSISHTMDTVFDLQPDGEPSSTPPTSSATPPPTSDFPAELTASPIQPPTFTAPPPPIALSSVSQTQFNPLLKASAAPVVQSTSAFSRPSISNVTNEELPTTTANLLPAATITTATVTESSSGPSTAVTSTSSYQENVSVPAPLVTTSSSEVQDVDDRSRYEHRRGSEGPEYDFYQRDPRDRRYDYGGHWDYYNGRSYQYDRRDRYHRPHSRTAYEYDPRYDPPRKEYDRHYDPHDPYYRPPHHYTSYYDERDYYSQRQRYDPRYQRSDHDYYQYYDDPYYQGRYPQDKPDYGYYSYHDSYYNDYRYHGQSYHHPPRSASIQDPPPSAHHQPVGEYMEPQSLEASAIYGQQDQTDTSYSYYQYEGEMPYESTHIEQPPVEGYPSEYGYTHSEHYAGEGAEREGEYSQPPDVSHRYAVGGYGEEQEWTPPSMQESALLPLAPPQRETPLPFAHPHVSVRFGIGGHLVTVLPIKPSSHTSAKVEIISIQNIIPEFVELSEKVATLPGPLVLGDSPKSSVVKYAAKRADQSISIAQSTDTSATDQEIAKDDALLWNFLVLLCQQNGVVVPSDVSDLLTQETTPSIAKSPRGVGVGGAGEEKASGLDELRQLLLSGRKKEALDLACSQSLWGHALMLASRMDDQSRTYVVNRFTASLQTSDPLSTFYTLMLGRMPSVAKPEGLTRAGDWRPHLAMMITNMTSQQDTSCIISLGDSLLSRGRLPAAHFCYHLANIPLGDYGDTQCKYSLLGSDHTSLTTGVYPYPEQLVRTEILEYALGLSKPDFALPSFQIFKLLHIFKLVEAGLVKKALRYCESISCYVVRNPKSCNSTFLILLQELSSRLHYASCPLGVMESELPSWILTLEQALTDIVSTTHTPAVSRGSPSFSSAGGGLAVLPQPSSSYTDFGQYLQIPGTEVPSQSYSIGNTQEDFRQVTAPNYDGSSQQESHIVENMLPGSHGPFGEMGTVTSDGGSATPLIITDATDHFQTGLTSTDQFQTGLTNTDQFQMGLTSTYQFQTGLTSMDQVQTDLTSTDQVQPNLTGSQSQATLPYDSNQMNASNPEAQFPSNYLYNLYGAQPSLSNTAEQQQIPTDTTSTGGYGSQTHLQGSAATSHTDVSTTPLSSSSQITGYNNDMFTMGIGPPPTADSVPPSYSTFSISAPSVSNEAFSSQENSPKDDKKSEIEDTSEEDREDNSKEKKDDKHDPNAKGWLGIFNPFNYIPKGPKNAHLPDDKNPRIIFDKEKNKWVDLDADEQEESGPVAPPTDMELKSNDTTDGSLGSNSYSLQQQGVGRGRFNVRSRYVDVLSKGGQKTVPPLGVAPPSLMPSTATMQFNPTNFFVPQPASTNEGSSFDEAYGLTGANSTTTPTSTTPQTERQEIDPHTQPLNPPTSHPPSSQNHVPSETTVASTSNISIGMPQMPSTDNIQQVPSQPQFFNPNTFMKTSTIPGRLQKPDPFPDNASDTSSMSEYSQEVSQINRKVMRVTKPGTRSRYQYPRQPTAGQGLHHQQPTAGQGLHHQQPTAGQGLHHQQPTAGQGLYHQQPTAGQGLHHHQRIDGQLPPASSSGGNWL